MRIFSHGWSSGFDGPGRRLGYYLKGCNSKCLWCGNPESISMEKEMLFYPERSTYNAESCPHGAVVADRRLNREKCSNCDKKECVDVWHDPFFKLPDIVLPQMEAAGNGCTSLLGQEKPVPFCSTLMDSFSSFRDMRDPKNPGTRYNGSGCLIHGTFVNFLDLSPAIQEDIIKRLEAGGRGA